MFRRTAAAFAISSACFGAYAPGGVIAQFTREGAGGVPGVRHAIRLPLAVCPHGAASCEDQALELFERLSLGPANVGRTVRADASVDDELGQIVEQLTDGDEDVLRFRPSFVRISGGVVQGDPMTLAEFDAFFPTHPTFVDFSQFVVEEVRMILEALALSSPGSDANGDGEWTDYSYRVTYTVMGYPVAKVDCRAEVDPDPPNPDGRTTLADWRYLRTRGCLRGPTLPVLIGCDCGNADANIVNEFDMDLRDVAIFQNSFYPP